MRIRGFASHGAVFIAGVVVAGAFTADAVPSQRARYQSLDAFAESLSYIVNQYVEPVDDRKLIYGAVGGMVEQLDSHSSFFPPNRYRRLRQDTEGEFVGIGLELGDGEGERAPPVVETVVPRSPAERAGARVGDRLLAINGKTTVPASGTRGASSWHTKLRGRSGSRVTIRLLRSGWKSSHDLTLVREHIKVPTVERRVLGGGISYIRVTKFQEATAADVRKALAWVRSRGALRGLILDLRNNPGGLLDQGIEVADLFLDGGVIVSVRGRKGAQIERHVAHAAGSATGFPMITLVDQGSASAAEIVAGALKDHKRSKLLGLATFGKGSVQTFLGLSDGSGLKLTTARYFTPSGASLEGTGIKPDIEVEAFDAEDIVAGRPPEHSAGGQTESTAAKEDRGAGARTSSSDSDFQEDRQMRTAYQMLRRIVGSKK